MRAKFHQQKKSRAELKFILRKILTLEREETQGSVPSTANAVFDNKKMIYDVFSCLGHFFI
jgi:hypothetical protein